MLLGSSGVGKSTIVNALVGEELLDTQEVRADDQTRPPHDDPARADPRCPSGGVVLDTPGIRELQLWDADLEQTFGDVEEIARRCRFCDCNHDQEPGCAIREALADGVAPADRWQSYVEAAARARGDRGAPQPPTATGTRPRIQDSRTREQAEEETLTPPRVREDAVEFVLPDPEHRFERGGARAGGGAPAAPGRRSRGATARGGSTFPRPDVDRLEYLLGVDGTLRPGSGQPAARARPVRRQVGRRVAGVRAAGLARLDRRRRPRRGARASLPPARRTRARAALRDAGAARRGRAAARGARRPRVRRLRGAYALPRRDELGGAHPTAARGADPAGRPQRDVLGVRALCRRARARAAAARSRKRAPHGKRIGMGASLGALAMLHAHVRHPEVVRRPPAPVGQLLPPALRQARVGFPRYRRITRFVGTVFRGVDVARPIPVAITCGTAEENRANNEAVAEALIASGLSGWLARVRDAHNWTCWRDAFDPHLPALIEAVDMSAARGRHRRRRGARIRPLRPAGASRSRPRTARLGLGGARDGRRARASCSRRAA